MELNRWLMYVFLHQTKPQVNITRMSPTRQTKPDWDRLYETALAQEGHFTTHQALDAGYSSQLLVKHLKNGKITRIRRSVYRLKHFPPGQQEDLVVLWLWSERAGVFSYETALMLL